MRVWDTWLRRKRSELDIRREDIQLRRQSKVDQALASAAVQARFTAGGFATDSAPWEAGMLQAVEAADAARGRRRCSSTPPGEDKKEKTEEAPPPRRRVASQGARARGSVVAQNLVALPAPGADAPTVAPPQPSFATPTGLSSGARRLETLRERIRAKEARAAGAQTAAAAPTP